MHTTHTHTYAHTHTHARMHTHTHVCTHTHIAHTHSMHIAHTHSMHIHTYSTHTHIARTHTHTHSLTRVDEAVIATTDTSTNGILHHCQLTGQKSGLLIIPNLTE